MPTLGALLQQGQDNQADVKAGYYATYYDAAGNLHSASVDKSTGMYSLDGGPGSFSFPGTFGSSKGGPFFVSNGKGAPGFAFPSQLLRTIGFAEAKGYQTGGNLLGYGHSGIDKWIDTPPGFPEPPRDCVWRSWHQPAQNSADWFVAYVGQACKSDAFRKIGPGPTLLASLAAQWPEGSPTHDDDLLVLTGALPVPPPCQYWSSHPLDNGVLTCWHSLNAAIGNLKGTNNAGGFAPTSVMCAPPGCYWFSEGGQIYLRYKFPDDAPVDADAVATWAAADAATQNAYLKKWADANLPTKMYGPANAGGYTTNPSDSKTLADSDRYWTTDDKGFYTDQTPFNLGGQIVHIVEQVGGPILIAISAIVAIFPGLQAVGGVGIALGIALKGLGSTDAGNINPGGFRAYVPGATGGMTGGGPGTSGHPGQLSGGIAAKIDTAVVDNETINKGTGGLTGGQSSGGGSGGGGGGGTLVPVPSKTPLLIIGAAGLAAVVILASKKKGAAA